MNRSRLPSFFVTAALIVSACGGQAEPRFVAVDDSDVGTDQLCDAVNQAIDAIFLSYEITLNPELTRNLVAELPVHIQQRIDGAMSDDDADFYLEWATQADLVTTEQCGVPAFRSLAHLEAGCLPPTGLLDAVACADPRARGYDSFLSLAEMWPTFQGWRYEVSPELAPEG